MITLCRKQTSTRSSMKIRDIAPYGVRMPAEMKQRLMEEAKKNNRSLNSEILVRLERSLTTTQDHVIGEGADFIDRLKLLEQKIEELRQDYANKKP